jgi:hypothetical protein
MISIDSEVRMSEHFPGDQSLVHDEAALEKETEVLLLNGTGGPGGKP